MTSHEEEELISSPLSSPRSSIYGLDDFNFIVLPDREQGPGLTDDLPPFHPQAAAPATDRPSTSKSTGSTGSVKVDCPPGNEGDGDLEAHYDTNIPDACPAEEDHPLNVLVEQRAATPGHSPKPPTSTSHYGRKRKAPASATAAAAPASSKKKETPAAKRARKNDAKKWEAPSVFTDARSPLTSVPLRAILLHPKAWDVLSPADQAELRALLLAQDRHASLSQSPSPPPGSSSSGVANAREDDGDGKKRQSPLEEYTRPDLDYLRSDDSFRFDCARYSENVEEGRHDRDWLAEAWVAHERRKRGDFRGYLRQKLERDWEVEVPVTESEDGGPAAEEDGVAAAEEEEGEEDQEGHRGGDMKAQAQVDVANESPVPSSVGETQLTQLKLEVAPLDGEQTDLAKQAGQRDGAVHAPPERNEQRAERDQATADDGDAVGFIG